MAALSVDTVLNEYCGSFLGVWDYRDLKREEIAQYIDRTRKHLLKYAASSHHTTEYNVEQDPETMESINDAISVMLAKEYNILYEDFLAQEEREAAQKILSIPKIRNKVHRIVLLQFVADNGGCTSFEVKKHFPKLSLTTIQLCLLKYTERGLLKREQEKRGKFFRYQILEKGLDRIRFLKVQLSSAIKEPHEGIVIPAR